MNVAVINLKKISRNMLKLIIFTVFLFVIIRVLITHIIALQNILTFETSSSLFTSFFVSSNEKNYEIDQLKLFAPFCPFIVATNTVEKVDNPIEQEQQVVDNKDNVIIPKVAQTESVSERNLPESYNMTYGDVRIRNQSDCELTDDIFNPDTLALSNSKKILIYHTHTCESYTPSEKYNYTMTGNYRTTDNNYNVVKLRRSIKNVFRTKRIYSNT